MVRSSSPRSVSWSVRMRASSAVTGRSGRPTSWSITDGPGASMALAPDTRSSAGRMLRTPEISATAARTAVRSRGNGPTAWALCWSEVRVIGMKPSAWWPGGEPPPPDLPAPARHRVDGLARNIATGDVVRDVRYRFVRVDRVLLAGELVECQVDGRLTHAVGIDVRERGGNLAEVVAGPEVDVDGVGAGSALDHQRDVRPLVGLGQLGLAAHAGVVQFAERDVDLTLLHHRRRFRTTTRGGRDAGRRMMHVLEPLMRRTHVGELRQERHIVCRHAVAELTVGPVLEFLAEEEAGGNAQLDIDDLVAEPAAVREAGVVTADNAERVLCFGRRDADVEPQHLAGGDVLWLIQSRHAGQEDLNQIVASRFGHGDQRVAVEQIEQLGDFWISDRAQELGVVPGMGRVEEVLRS